MSAALLTTLIAAATTASAAVANPDLQPACGAKVVMVLDESGSIDTTPGAETAVRSAANAFATGLADTGSQLAVIEFGSSAKRVLGYTDVTSGAGGTLATTFQPYFSGAAIAPADVYDSPSQTGAWTNWQDALEEVNLLNGSSGVAPLVVFITDGDPTAINTPTGVQVGVANATALAPAVVQADSVKAQGSHILAVGVGAALNNPASLARLTAISGPDTVSTAATVDLATTDVLAVADFASLPGALPSLVNALCRSSVTITKLIETGGTTAPGGAGWQFSGTVATAAGGYAWLAPDPGAAGLRTAATGQDSAATFQWKPAVPTTSTVTLTEAVRQGHLFAGVACQVASASGQGPVALPVVVTGATFSLTLGPTDVVTCVVRNTVLPALPQAVQPVPPPAVEVPTSGVTIGTPQTTLRIRKLGPSAARAGQVVTYRIRVTNAGAVAARDVVMRDRVPSGMALAARPAGVQLVKGVVIVSVGTLEPGGSKTILVAFRIDRPQVGVRTNVATASGSNAREVRDSTRTRIIKVTGRIRIPVVTG